MVEGRVISPNNEPIRGVTLVLVDFRGASRRTTMTDDSDAFVFSDLRPGVYEIQTSMPGFQPRSVRLDHDGERDDSLRIVLEPRAASGRTCLGGELWGKCWSCVGMHQCAVDGDARFADVAQPLAWLLGQTSAEQFSDANGRSCWQGGEIRFLQQHGGQGF